MTNLEITEERLRNTRAWAAARVGSLSGADVIVAAIDELLRYREIVGYELAEPTVTPEPGANRLTDVEHRLVRAEAEILRLGPKALETDYMRQFPEPYIPGGPTGVNRPSAHE